MKHSTVIVGLLALALTGCNDGTPESVQLRQQARIHQIAQQVVELPGVVCAQGQLDSDGLPSARLGSLRVRVTFDASLDRPARLAVFEQIGQTVWESDLIVTSLVVGDGSGLGLEDSIGADVGSPAAADLERAFGPKPPRPSPLPELADPGNPPCRA